MKAILLALTLAAVSLTGVGFALWATRGKNEPEAPWRDAGLMPPASIQVLSGERDGLEVLLKRRFELEERVRFTDRTLSRRLGLEPDQWSFFELWVANRSGGPVTVDPRELSLEDDRGAPVEVRSLRSLVRKDTPERKLLLGLHAPPSDRALDPGRFRRLLVALPRATQMGDLARGRLGEIALQPGRGRRNELERYHERPGGTSLLAALEAAPKEPSATIGPVRGQGQEDDR